jgi:hypothetical protein
MSEDKMLRGQGTMETSETGANRESNSNRGRFDLIPYEAMEAYAKWIELGAEKYGDRNWEKGVSVKRCICSMVRHALKAANGWTDEDHLAACMWNAAAAITMLARFRGKEGIDDHPWSITKGYGTEIKQSICNETAFENAKKRLAIMKEMEDDGGGIVCMPKYESSKCDDKIVAYANDSPCTMYPKITITGPKITNNTDGSVTIQSDLPPEAIKKVLNNIFGENAAEEIMVKNDQNKNVIKRKPCIKCNGTGLEKKPAYQGEPCWRCRGTGEIIGD